MKDSIWKSFLDRLLLGSLVSAFFQFLWLLLYWRTFYPNLNNLNSTPSSLREGIYIFGHFLICSLLVGGLLNMTFPTLSSYKQRWVFVFLVGVTMTVFNDGGAILWDSKEVGEAIPQSFFTISTWTLSASLLAWIVRPRIQKYL